MTIRSIAGTVLHNWSGACTCREADSRQETRNDSRRTLCPCATLSGLFGFSCKANRCRSASVCEGVAESDAVADWVVEASEVDVLAHCERMRIKGIVSFLSVLGICQKLS